MSEPVTPVTSEVKDPPDLLLIGVWLIASLLTCIYITLVFAVMPHLRAMHWNSTVQCQQSNAAACK